MKKPVAINAESANGVVVYVIAASDVELVVQAAMTGIEGWLRSRADLAASGGGGPAFELRVTVQ